MVNRFSTFENDDYSGHNGIRHSRGTRAYAEVNQDTGEQSKGARPCSPTSGTSLQAGIYKARGVLLRGTLPEADHPRRLPLAERKIASESHLGLPSDFVRKGLLLLRGVYVRELAATSYPHIQSGGGDFRGIAVGGCGERLLT